MDLSHGLEGEGCALSRPGSRVRRRTLSWLLSPAQSHSHTEALSLSRFFWLRGRGTHSNYPKPQMEDFNKDTRVFHATQGKKCSWAPEPERHQISEQLLCLTFPGPGLHDTLSLFLSGILQTSCLPLDELGRGHPLHGTHNGSSLKD